ncbi:hypothetical protein [Bacillus clarus]|uniref:Uncharacterized protein n=1 Tax=Bacillus clarus TaxID=2338372 RepID=A0A090YZY0_9BACI|nr:hypothetical protein [Bacillus clarus]KFN04529.1 hypothetical protein DJ93_2000 [Bacillus clarus]
MKIFFKWAFITMATLFVVSISIKQQQDSVIKTTIDWLEKQ